MSSVRFDWKTGAQPGLTMSISISASWLGRWMMMLSGEWFAPNQARSMRSPPISSVRWSWNVSSFGGRADVVRVMVRVNEIVDLVADAVCRCDLVDRALDVVADRRRRVEHDDAVRGGQEGALVRAVRDPVEIPLHPVDVIALLVESGAERRLRDRRVVRQVG